jgi:predicted dehydrogenase
MKNGLIGDIVGASCHYDQGSFWDVRHRPEWSDMEYQLRNWFNVKWIGGDHVLDQGVHSIDVFTWFLDEEMPIQAVGYGGRARRRSGDIFDFFSIDYTYSNGKRGTQTARQIDGTAGNVSEQIFGTKGIVQLSPRHGHKIVDWDGNVLWEYDYDANPVPNPYRQEHIHFVESIRLNKRINQAEVLAMSNQVAILGREATYTGRAITWNEIMASNLRYGPTEYSMGPISHEHFQEGVVPIPGVAPASAMR